MIYIFCDTCVLLNLAIETKLEEVIKKLFQLKESGQIELVVSNVVLEELEEHKDKIVDKRIASYKGHLRNLKNILDLFEEKTQELLKSEIETIHQNLPKRAGVLNKNINLIVDLVKQSIQVENKPQNIFNVIKRAKEKSFPFHKNKNSVKDALISEAFVEFLKSLPADTTEVYFVTDNTEDFSDTTNKTLPHKDWESNFKDKVYYSTNIASIINSIEPESITEEIVQEIEDKSNFSCINNSEHDFDTERGFWRHSQFGGGLSWHHSCKKCGMLWDTGDFYD